MSTDRWMDKEDVVHVHSGMLSALLRCFGCVWVCATLWTVTHQALLSTGFSRQEYWGGLPCPSPGVLPNSGIEPASLMSPALAGRFFTTMKYYTTIKKQWNNGICSNMDGPGDDHTKWGQPKTNIIVYHLYTEPKKNGTNELIYRTEKDLQA